MRIAIAIAAMLLTGSAIAGPKCTTEPRSKWLSKQEMVRKIEAANYTIGVFKVTSGQCYEIYGRDKNGRRVEVYFHPITGETVRNRSH